MRDIIPTLLVVADEPSLIETIAQAGRSTGFAVVTTCSTGRLRPGAARPDLVIIDLGTPGSTGDGEVLRAIRDDYPRCPIILTTDDGTIESAVAAMKNGLLDYLLKPLDTTRLGALLSRAYTEARRRHSAEIAREAREQECFGLIGTSPAMRRLLEAIRRMAPFLRTALIHGETGTGKELVARALHRAGRRADRRFVTVNCSAVVETLFESELFGHVRGAFTGATETTAGLFEAADGGVLFLDEVGELPLGSQAKLLRVLEFGEVQRVGALQSRRVDVLVLAATNRDLRQEIAAGRFRRDLFYRLNIVDIPLPALRDRLEDIPALAQAFVLECGARWNKPVEGLTDSAVQMLAYPAWNGNVRELRNVIERACLVADAPVITALELAPCLPPHEPAEVNRHEAAPDSHASETSTIAAQNDTSPPRLLSLIQRDHIVRTLEHAHGNKKAAAVTLGVSRRALYRSLERLGLESTISRRTPAHVVPVIAQLTPGSV
jgi:DNA-binding NtrC family response regulator